MMVDRTQEDIAQDIRISAAEQRLREFEKKLSDIVVQINNNQVWMQNAIAHNQAWMQNAVGQLGNVTQPIAVVEAGLKQLRDDLATHLGPLDVLGQFLERVRKFLMAPGYSHKG